MSSGPLTLGTAGHIDHGKTALIRRLTGTDTDRLPEERTRGISIDLGYAQLELPSGRTLSVIDVPGHERFVRTMIAGATGIDLFLLAVAADDGVMPQTVEHVRVLRALGVTRGVLTVTKCDLADPAAALEAASELLADAGMVVGPPVACSTRTGVGLDALAQALAHAAETLPGRADDARPALLHVDRVFTVKGAGTVVTGTLWSGTISAGDRLRVLPRGQQVRVRSVQVHNAPVRDAACGQRVALNLVGVKPDEIARGDAVAAPGAVVATHILDAALELSAVPPRGRVIVHHGTRASPARLVALGGGRFQLRAEHPLLARDGDHLVIRNLAPPDTLGGGVVLDAHPRRHSRTTFERERGQGQEQGQRQEPPGDRVANRLAASRQPELSARALALEQRLRQAGYEPPSDAELGAEASELPALVLAGRAVRIGRSMHIHVEALEGVSARAVAILQAEGQLTLARLRDDLGTSRRYAQALIEHLDATRVTVRRPDDTRVLRRRALDRQR